MISTDASETREDEDAFRLRVRAWLEQNAERLSEDGHQTRMVDHRMDARIIAASKDWQRKLFHAGLAGITWPEEWGGAGKTPILELVLKDEIRNFAHPSEKLFGPAEKLYGPTIMAFGSTEQKEKHLRSMLRGDEVWCQLFSEPEAGSDLADVRTRIVRDGDELVIDGQKIWSSRAQYSDYGLLIGRSDPSLSKHAGISALIVDMRVPGVDVRPISQIDGGDSFAEVFFTGARVPAHALLGEWNEGWGVARRTLMNERFALASRGQDAGLTQLRQMAEAAGLANDKVIRHRLVDIHIKVQLLRYLGLRLESAARRQVAPGPEGSVAKLLYGEVLDAAAALGMELLGPWGMTSTLSGPDDLAHPPSPDESAEPYGLWQAQLLGAPSAHIAGGTDQILRNLIGERMLGLPREPALPNHNQRPQT